MKHTLILCALAFVGCAGPQSALEPPVIDQRGVDPTKYAQDLGYCTDQKRDKFITVGAPITSCMRERGYAILVPKG